MTTSAGNIIDGALRLIGVLAEGETPSGPMASDALSAMNQMIESWSTERLSVFTTMDQQFVWPANQRFRTLGPTGDFVGIRPILLDSSTYFVANQLSFGVQIINEDAYNSIAQKTNTSTYPQVLYVNMGYPDVTVYLYPVPTEALEFHFVSVEPLDTAAVQGTELAFPPGYLRAFRFNLAVELATEFGVEPPANVSRIAMSSKRTLKRVNNPLDVMSFPVGILNIRGQNEFNIFTGLPF